MFGIYTQFGLSSKYLCNKNCTIPDIINLISHRANFPVRGPTSFDQICSLVLSLGELIFQAKYFSENFDKSLKITHKNLSSFQRKIYFVRPNNKYKQFIQKMQSLGILVYSIVNLAKIPFPQKEKKTVTVLQLQLISQDNFYV